MYIFIRNIVDSFTSWGTHFRVSSIYKCKPCACCGMELITPPFLTFCLDIYIQYKVSYPFSMPQMPVK